MRKSIRDWLLHHFGGHISIGHWFVWYGLNAMKLAINVHTRKWGWICIRPPFYFLCWKWGWYFYVSPNGTPQASTFAIGPGVARETKEKSFVRRFLFGHNFSTDLLYDIPDNQDLIG